MGNCLSGFRSFCAKSDHEPDADFASNAVNNSRYAVFISHAGEDKATIAIPLRQKLQEQGITAFVDEADMPPGTEAPPAMTDAMETAKVAVIVLSPEFVAKKWPMWELLCFLRRREECMAEGREVPVVIPVFYRLKVDELYDEPRLDRTDKDGNLLYHQTRFYERQENEEPEANIAGIKAALETVHRIMGLRNYVDATNDPSYEMSQRREILLQELSDKVRQAVPARAVTNKRKKRTARRAKDNMFHPHFDVPYDTSDLVFDFDEKRKNGTTSVRTSAQLQQLLLHRSNGTNGKTSTQEGQLLQLLLHRSKGTNRSIGVRGIGGVGKTSLLQGIRNLKKVRRRFRGGVYDLPLGLHATRGELILALSSAVRNSGGYKKADVIRRETDIQKAIHLFRTWFAKKRCLFVIDDVWETKEVPLETIHALLQLHASGRGSKVLLTTRSGEIASTADTPFRLEPRDALEPESRKILFGYSRIEPEQDQNDDHRAVNEILKQCGGLPLFLAVAGKAFRTLSFRRALGGCVAYHIYAERLKTCLQTLINEKTNSYEGLSPRLRISVELLENRKEDIGFRVKLPIADMHRWLSALTKQRRVSMDILKHLWELETEMQAADMAREFEQVGLADVEFERRESGPVEILRFHDSVYEFAVFEARRHSEEKVGHEALLRGYRQGSIIGEQRHEWLDIEADGYIHANLCRHLLGAERAPELVQLLLSPQWAEKQLHVNGILFLVADFALGIEAVPNAMPDASTEERTEMKTVLRLISQAVNMSSAFIARNIAELWYQVSRRLQRYVESYCPIRDYMNRIETEGTKPLILCKSSFPGEARGAHMRSLSVDKTEKLTNRHQGLVSSVSFTADGNFVVSGSWDKTLRIWDSRSGTQVGDPLEGHLGPVRDVAVTADRRHILSVSDDRELRVWDFESRKLLQKFKDHTHWILCVAITPQADRAVTGSADNTIRVWNLTAMDGSHVVLAGHSTGVEKVFVTDDGSRIVSVDWGDNIFVWDLETNQVTKRFTASDDHSCVLSAMKRRGILSLVDEKTIHDYTALSIPLHLREIKYGEGPHSKILGTLEALVRSWALSPDRKTICVGLWNGQVDCMTLVR